MLPFVALASGMLTGKYRRDEAPPAGTRLANAGTMAARALSERSFDRVEALAGFATEHGQTLLSLAFAWLLARPVVCSVIAGATRPEQLLANAAAANWALNSDDLARIDALAPLRG